MWISVTANFHRGNIVLYFQLLEQKVKWPSSLKRVDVVIMLMSITKVPNLIWIMNDNNWFKRIIYYRTSSVTHSDIAFYVECWWASEPESFHVCEHLSLEYAGFAPGTSKSAYKFIIYWASMKQGHVSYYSWIDQVKYSIK